MVDVEKLREGLIAIKDCCAEQENCNNCPLYNPIDPEDWCCGVKTNMAPKAWNIVDIPIIRLMLR